MLLIHLVVVLLFARCLNHLHHLRLAPSLTSVAQARLSPAGSPLPHTMVDSKSIAFYSAIFLATSFAGMSETMAEGEANGYATRAGRAPHPPRPRPFSPLSASPRLHRFDAG